MTLTQCRPQLPLYYPSTVEPEPHNIEVPTPVACGQISVLYFGGRAAYPGGTNNAMEAQELLSGFMWPVENHRDTPTNIIGDSTVVISMVLKTNRVRSLNLAPYIRTIRELLFQLRVVTLQAEPRAFNTAADGLCNWVMDLELPNASTFSAHDSEWALPMHLTVDPIQHTVTTTAQSERSPFDVQIHRESVVNGITRCVPLGIFRRFQQLATKHHIFSVNRVFLKPSSAQFTIPVDDVRLFTAITRLLDMGIESDLLLFRGQTRRDQPSNKALRPKLYRKFWLHTPTFSCSVRSLNKDIPISKDGRIIHYLSAPSGTSINDVTNSDWTPDARWELYSRTAERVLELRRKNPHATIYALGADIAGAILHVPVHARHASALYASMRVGIFSGTAVFGWTASPAYFVVFGKAVRHYQRTGSSYVLGFPEPFWIFQWVDDIVIIEDDIGDRLIRAERRLRDTVKLVFGSGGWHEGKLTT
ncbi:LOW QUALITY PROTEIN: hypothetical protein PHMEG_00021154 [Phytophthora megakarya]|uniref:Uncharacterized protein n=1 Tax=Phytophthora megakarya TaxID=4795 RepID=A0A225VPV3_9STRA|nr:LOW QUALITY PROTEIN: hypothetical protein PHMEG_00021154 [Phytophthora megakarya]